MAMTVLVLGGGGFIGRHAVKALLKKNVTIVIGTRSPNKTDTRIPDCAQHLARRKVCLDELLLVDDWISVIDDVDVVLNCVGILRQVGGATYDKVQHLAPSALALACVKQNKRIIHVSALSLSACAKSRFLISKLQAEAAIKASKANWIIARPSLLDGEGGYGASWLEGVSRLPVFVVPANAKGRIAALDVNELGEALANLCTWSEEKLKLHESREFDLGGAEQFTFENYIRTLRKRYSHRKALCITVPGFAARIVSHICDIFHVTPFSFGHWELLGKDNIPSKNRLAELLEREPKIIQ